MKAYLAVAAYLCSLVLAQSGSGCVSELDSPFTITVDIPDTVSKRDTIANFLNPAHIFKRQSEIPVTPSDSSDTSSSSSSSGGGACPVRSSSSGSSLITPVFSLKSGGVLTDDYTPNRLCSIVSNKQFQCDPSPGQDTALYTKGFSICNNKNLASQGNTNWVICYNEATGSKGAFWNVYDGSHPTGGEYKHCQTTTIEIKTCTMGGSKAKRVVPWVEEQPGSIRKRDPFPMNRIGKMAWPLVKN